MRSESSDHHEKDIFKQLKKTNLYEILDVKNNASDADIKKSFKKMALKYHPDKNPASYSKQVFHKISQAYDTLSDSNKRSAYDEKQDRINMKTQFTYSKSNPFFYDSSNFNSAFDSKFHQKSSQFDKKYSHWSAQFKMDQKARRQRQWFRKQRNQYKEQQNKQNQSFDTKANSKNYGFEKSFFSDKKQKQNQQEAFKRQRSYFNFNFQKSTFKKTSQRYSADYEEVRKQMERKQRLQKQKQKANKNIRTFLLFILIIVAWLTFSHLGPTMKGIPVYSMYPSQNYNISRFTKELHTPFYATKQYIQRTLADDRFRLHLDRKIDLVYIKTLSKVCNTMIQKQEELYSNLDIAKSKKSRKQINRQIQNLDMSACDKLHDTRQMNPQYFKELFSDPRNKEQM